MGHPVVKAVCSFLRRENEKVARYKKKIHDIGMKLTHLALTVSAMDASIAFYQTFLNMSILRDRRGEGGNTVWIGFPENDPERPSFVLVLMEGRADDKINHLGFEVASPDEVNRRVEFARNHGIPCQGPYDLGFPVGYFAMVEDPDGHVIEFTFGQPLEGIR